MRSTGKLHFGHYLGVIDNWVKLQDEYDCYFFVADWHALTTKYDKTEDLRQNVLDVVMDWIAAKGYHTGNIMNAFRLTLVGEGKGPHMFDISWVLGKEETLSRMKRAVEILK